MIWIARVYLSSYGRIYKCVKRRIAIKIVLFIEKTVQFLWFKYLYFYVLVVKFLRFDFWCSKRRRVA